MPCRLSNSHDNNNNLKIVFLCTHNETVKELTERQIAVNLDNGLKYFSRILDILNLYQLSSIDILRDSLSTKEQWKLQFKSVVHNYWAPKLRNEACVKSALCSMNFETAKVGKRIQCGPFLESSVTDVKKGIVKCRMLTGTY